MPVAKVEFTAGLNATPYTANDVVGGTLHFKQIPANTELILTSTKLDYYVATNPGSAVTSMTLNLYDRKPPSALADNAAFDIPAGDRAGWICSILLGSVADKGSTLSVETDQNNKHIKSGPEGLYGYISTTAGYTPAGNAESYAITLAALYAIEPR